jgi:hypothetical protein
LIDISRIPRDSRETFRSFLGKETYVLFSIEKRISFLCSSVMLTWFLAALLGDELAEKSMLLVVDTCSEEEGLLVLAGRLLG